MVNSSNAPERELATCHLFTYGTLRSQGSAVSMLRDCELLGQGEVGGVLYDMDGVFPALVLYGRSPIYGDVWRCPSELLLRLDAYEGVQEGLFRRVAVKVTLDDERDVACWTYVAGPKLARRLTPARRITRWPASPSEW